MIQIGIIMGSQSDWPTMQKAEQALTELGIESEVRIVSAHRTPDRLWNYAQVAEAVSYTHLTLPTILRV